MISEASGSDRTLVPNTESKLFRTTHAECHDIGLLAESSPVLGVLNKSVTDWANSATFTHIACSCLDTANGAFKSWLGLLYAAKGIEP